MGDDGAREVVWVDRPDPDRGVFYPIWSPKSGRDVNVLVLSDHIHGAMLHYFDARDRPCLFDKERCEGCRRQVDARWTGFLACWHRQTGRLGLAKITKEAFLRCPQFETWAGNLRGLQLRLVRAGDAKNARVTATLTKYEGSLGSLPPAFNVRTALENLWFARPRKLQGGDVATGKAAGPGREASDHVAPPHVRGSHDA